ncbi:MAG: hypothetical protein ACHQ1D_08620 [Nitrososphaerales archaeon]
MKSDYLTITTTRKSGLSTDYRKEEPQTKDLVKSPLDTANSIELSKEIIDILTDSDRDNDQIACDLPSGINGKQMNNILEIINC